MSSSLLSTGYNAYEEEDSGYLHPPDIRRAVSDSAILQEPAMQGGPAEHLYDEPGQDHEHEHDLAIGQQEESYSHSHLTPDRHHPQHHNPFSLRNPKLAALNPNTGSSPYTPVDLNVYLQTDHATPTPARISPSQHLLPPLSGSTSSSRAHSPSGSNSNPNRSPSISPLPTLSELRNLQRANSAAGRLMAMKKLMGQTPPSPTSLRRAGSLNVQAGARGQEGMGMGRVMMQRDRSDDTENDDEDGDESGQETPAFDQDNVTITPERTADAEGDRQLAYELGSFNTGMLGSPTKQTGARRNPNRNRRLGSIDLLRSVPSDDQYQHQPDFERDLDLGPELGSARQAPATPPSAFPRPRLGRSNTVGTGGGEERRSVIGRRMMERLGSRTRVINNENDEGGSANEASGKAAGPVGLQGLMQRAKERREMEARAREAEEVAQAEAQNEDAEEEDPPQFEEDRVAAEPLDYSAGTAQPHVPASPEEAQPYIVERFSPSPPTGKHDLDETIDDSPGESVNAFNEVSGSPPIVLSPVVTQSQPRVVPPGVLKRDPSDTVGRSSYEGGMSSDSDHPRGSVMFAETSGSEDSHQRYHRQHSPYFGLGHAAGQGQSLFAGPSELARSVSQATARSGMSDKFEYEAHLRRSGSLKRNTRASMVTPTPGDVVGNVTMEEILDADDSAIREDTIEEIQSPTEHRYHEDDVPSLMPSYRPEEARRQSLSSQDAQEHADGPEDLLPPLAPFLNEKGIPLRDSAGNQTGGKHSTTPSESSLGSNLSAIPFILSPGSEGSPETRAPRMPIPRRDMSMSSFPAEIHDGDRRVSDFSTPGRHNSSSVNSPSGTFTASKDSPGSSSIGLVTPRILDSVSSPEEYDGKTHRRLGSAFEERHRDHEVEELDDSASPAKYSIMSWHDVTDPADSPIPSEQYTKRSQGVVQTLKSTFRRNRSRSNSRSAIDQPAAPSVTPGTPTRGSHGSLASSHVKDGTNSSPHRESRRGSQRSDASSMVTGPHASMQSSIFSTAPSVVLPAGQTSPLPQIDPNDPRAFNSKLSPFVPQSMHAPLLQQASDSAVPTVTSSKESPPPFSRNLNRNSQTHLESSPSSAQASYYDLSAAKNLAARDERSIGKKSWLADTFFPPQGASTKRRPSVSNFLRRKGSTSQTSSRKNSVAQEGVEAVMPTLTPSTSSELPSSQGGGSPALAPPLDIPVNPPVPSAVPNKDIDTPVLKLATMPSTLSAVEERATPISPTGLSFNRTSSKASMFTNESDNRHEARATRLATVFTRLEALLSGKPGRRLAVLDDPPRKLVESVAVLQVVNNHTILNRHLFLFTDILVTAEPSLSEDPKHDTFLVKSVVSLETLEARNIPRPTVPLSLDTSPDVAEFRAQFGHNPDRAVDRLSEQTRIAQDSTALAEILFDSHDFDKGQLADYLVQPRNRALLDEYIRQFNFGGIRIDLALRVYILALRLPADNVGFESILQAFAKGWYQANISIIEYGLNTVRNLVLRIMKLNDGYHRESTFGFAKHESVMTSEEFITSFYEQDGMKVVPESLLDTLYIAIRREKYVQAGSAEEVDQRGRRAETSLISRETRQAAGEWSEPINLSIPTPDASLAIRLLGDGLDFDRDEIHFGTSRQQSFRVKGSIPGRFKVLFCRVGENAALYPSLPNGISVCLDPVFRSHNLELAFRNTLGYRRRCRFSFPSETSLSKFGSAIAKRIVATTAIKGRGMEGWSQVQLPDGGSLGPTFMQAADRMSLMTLSDILHRQPSASTRYAPEDDLEATPKASKTLGKWTMSSAQADYNAMEAGKFSTADQQPHGTPKKIYRTDEGHGGGVIPPSSNSLTGKELELVCRQNSLIPVVLGILEADKQSSTV